VSEPAQLTHRIVLTLVGFTLLTRLLALVLLPSDQYSFGDAHDYQMSAHALCTKLPYPDATELPFFRAPGLALFLAIITFCNPYITILSRLGLIFADLVSVVGLISLSQFLGLKPKAQLLTALIFAVSPLIVGQTLAVQSEPLFQCLLIWLAVALFYNTKRSHFIAGLLFGLASLTRPIAIGFLPLLIWGVAQLSPKIWIRSSLLFMLGALLTVSPWSYANYLRTGEFILINDGAGYNFWRGNHPIMKEIYNAADTQILAQLSQKLEHELTPALVAKKSSSSRSERSAYFFQQGVSNLIDSPSASLDLLITKCWVFLKPTLHAGAWPALIWWAIALWESLLYLLAAIALLRGQLPLRMRIGICAYLLFGLVLSLPFQVVTRFRVPLYEWVLIILAASLANNSRYCQKLEK
jgi:hypothetical protein